MLILWDEPKRATNLREHEVDFADVRAGFDFTTTDIVPSYKGRFAATGFLGDAMITVVFAPLGTEAISLISARAASRKERRAYDER